jgi:hypothetical protein
VSYEEEDACQSPWSRARAATTRQNKNHCEGNSEHFLPATVAWRLNPNVVITVYKDDCHRRGNPSTKMVK